MKTGVTKKMFGKNALRGLMTLVALSFIGSCSVSSAFAFDPIFDAPAPVPGPGAPFGVPPFGVPFPPPPGVVIVPGLPPVSLPGSGSHYGGMLPAVSTSSVDFDITEVDPPQAQGFGINIQVNADSSGVQGSVTFDNNDGMGGG